MKNLPPEVLAIIASFLPDRYEGKSVRPAIAAVSRAWQHVIEPLTFASLHLTSDHLNGFYSAFIQPALRCRLLRKLHLDIVLPRYSDEACGNYETADDRTANDKVVNLHLSALLHMLSQWPADGNLKLIIGIYSPMDPCHRNEEKRASDRHAVELGTRRDLFDERYKYSYIHLSNTWASVACVTSLLPQSGERCLDPGSLVTLTAAFPRLEKIDWQYQEPGFFLALRRQHLQEFADAVAAFSPPSSCKVLNIIIESPYFPHKERLPSLTTGRVSFCDALRVMVGKSNIQRISYRGPIDSTLFWPRRSSETESTGTWKSLAEFNIDFNIASLSGQWFFKGLPTDQLYNESSDMPLPQGTPGLFPPGYGGEEDDARAIAFANSMEAPIDGEGCIPDGWSFRQVPRDEAIVPLLEALAHRLTHTPTIRSADLESRLESNNGAWLFSYSGPGEISDYNEYIDNADLDSPNSRSRLFLHTGDWRSSQGLLDMLRGIGKARYREDTICTFLPNLY